MQVIGFLFLLVVIWVALGLFIGFVWSAIAIIAFFALVIIAEYFKVKGEEAAEKEYAQKLSIASVDNPILNTDMDYLQGDEFESYCSDLLRTDGFYDILVTPASGDNGIDLIAKKNNITYGIQCKRYAGTVGVKAVQEAFAGCKFYKCDKAVVMTNSFFTAPAVNMANEIGVILWDRNHIEKLKDNIVQHTETPELKTTSTTEHTNQSGGLKYQDVVGPKMIDGHKKKSKKKIVLIVIAACAVVGLIGLVIGMNSTNDDYLDDDYYSDYEEEYDDTSDYEEDYSEPTTTETVKTYEHPEVWMRESDIENTELGKPNSVEKCLDFDILDAEHRDKTYRWDNFTAIVFYHRHFSHNVDDYVNYPKNDGYVYSISYYDENGVYHSEDESDYTEKGIWDLQ